MLRIFLGKLFRQDKYAAAVIPYERCVETDGHKLSSDQHRVLIDQLAMSYGIAGDLKKQHDLLEDAIRQESWLLPELLQSGLRFSEEGYKGKVLSEPLLAFQPGPRPPRGKDARNPRADSSFQKYVRDEDFIKLMKKIGYD